MNYLEILLLLSGFLLTWYFLKINIPLFKKYLIDRPNNRSSHIRIKPTGGGVIFILIFIILNLFIFIMGINNKYLFLAFICLPLAVTGFIDDYKGLKNNIRFLTQLFISILLVISSDLINVDSNYILFAFYILAATSFINFSNFMDGIDGLLAGCLLIGFITAAISNQHFFSLWILIGTLLGFLIWNWSPSHIFMGDTGSTYLGALFIGYVYQSNNFHEAIGLTLVTAPLILDSICTLLRRLINRENIFRAHKKHTYQRLHQAGFNHSFVTLLYMLGSLFISIFFLKWGLNAAIFIVLIEFTIGVIIDNNLALAFNDKN